MSTNNITLTVDTAHNNRGIVAANNYGHQHNYYQHSSDRAWNKSSSQLRDRFFLSDPVVDRQALLDQIGGIVPGTCEWIRENAVYKDWLSGSSSPLWITGGPGKGKTMMATYLTAHLNEHINLVHSPGGSIISVYSYFCRANDDNRNSAVAILRGMIYQILREDPDMAESIVADMAGEKESATVLSSRERLWSLMEKMLDDIRIPNVYCLVDGLDECDQNSVRFMRQRLLGLAAKSNRSGTTGRVRWIVLSRGLGSLPGFVHISLETLQENIDEDINRVVVFTIDNITSTIMDVDNKKRLKKEILDSAEGSFLWAGPLVHEVARARSMKDVREVFQSGPEGTNNLYERMLWSIAPKSRNMCAAVLQWLALAFEPLDLAGLAEALGIIRTTKVAAIEELRDYIHDCGHLVQVQGNRVSLIHQSATRFLCRCYMANSYLAKFQISPTEAHYVIASRCIEYLESSGIHAYSIADVSYAQELDKESALALRCEFERRGFLQYAVEHWSQHVRESHGKFDSLADKFPSFFDLSSGTCTRSIACRKRSKGVNKRFLENALIIACREGILPWVKLLHEKPRRTVVHQWRRISKELKDTAMMEAVFERHKDIVIWLLDYGYDVNASMEHSYLGVERLPAVLFAFLMQAVDIVEIFAQRGATMYGKPFRNGLIQTQRNHGFGPFQTWLHVFILHCVECAGPQAHPSTYDWLLLCVEASWNETIRLLLQLGVEFPRQYPSSDSSCVLERATRSRLDTDIRTSLIQRVIDGDERYQRSRGVKGHAHSQSECGAPRQAVFHSRVSILESLLDNECFLSSIRSDPKVWCAAFGVAASLKTMISVKLFVDQFPHGNCVADDPKRNEAAVIELLLSKGIDPNMETNFAPDFALQDVPSKKLIRSGEDRMSAQREAYTMTPLDYAEWKENDQAVALLRQFGAKRRAEITDITKSFQPALKIA